MIFDIESNGSTRRVLTAKEPSLLLIRPSSPTIARRDSFLPPRHRRSYSASDASCCSGRFGELAGGTTAECAAIACCCPCGLANLLFLTIYKVPVGLCKKAMRRKRQQHLMKKGLLLPRARRCQCGCDNTEVQIHPIHGDPQSFDLQMMMGMHLEFDEDDLDATTKKLRSGGGEEMMKLEKEMWETFYDTGFWRSPSQREALGVVGGGKRNSIPSVFDESNNPRESSSTLRKM